MVNSRLAPRAPRLKNAGAAKYTAVSTKTPVKPPKNTERPVPLAERNCADSMNGFAQDNKNDIFQIMNLNKLRIFLYF